MAMSPNINDREQGKFIEGDNPGETKVRVAGNFSAQFTGLNVAGLVTEVTINNLTWTELPAAALTNRNAIAIQNRSGQEIKLNYSSGVVGYVGIIVDDRSERFYDITDNIPIYAKSKTSSCVLYVEELA